MDKARTEREEGGRRGVGKNNYMNRKKSKQGGCGKGSVKFGMSKGRGVI